MKRFSTAGAAAVAIIALGTVPATAATSHTSHPQPISGTVSGADSYAAPADCPAGATWRFSSAGSGRMSHLGRVTFQVTHCTFAGEGRFAEGELTITAANGDQLFLEHSGTFELVLDGSGTVVGSDVDLDWVIVGGTGRFAGASGSGEGNGSSVISGPTTSTTTMTFDGLISTAVGSGRSN